MILLVVLIIFICVACPFVPFFVAHLPKTIYWGCIDLYKYFKYKRWREFKEHGKILTYNGLFGAGKTLSMTHFVKGLYNQYNGLMIYDFDDKKWVKQNVHILSNYKLYGVDYEPLTNEQQIINCNYPSSDVVIVCLDEIGAIFNNRDFKNFTPDLLTAMLQCRKRKMLMVGTAQRFSMQDKNFRQTMESAGQCKKKWRFCRVSIYDAYELENCTNPMMLKPQKTRYWFVQDSDYNSYDTSEMVTHLKKTAEDGKLLTSSEISAKQGDGFTDSSFATHKKRRFK